MRVFLSGANGLLGQKIVQKLSADKTCTLFASSKGANRNSQTNNYSYYPVDVCSKEAVLASLNTLKPTVIINTAAMTNVDDCEKNQEACWQANVEAVKTLVDWAKMHKARFIQLSTDFIFDGQDGPYDETASPKPLSYYGKSKLAAEEYIQAANLDSWAIARTIIVYGTANGLTRTNIVLWAKDQLTQGKTISIVDDQLRSPTFAEDLADGCIQLMHSDTNGVFNLAGPETMSMYAFVCRLAKCWQVDEQLVKPVKTGEFVQTAPRPLKSGLIINKAKELLGYSPHSIEDSLAILANQL